jgi:hypothetical protein
VLLSISAELRFKMAFSTLMVTRDTGSFFKIERQIRSPWKSVALTGINALKNLQIRRPFSKMEIQINTQEELFFMGQRTELSNFLDLKITLTSLITGLLPTSSTL